MQWKRQFHPLQPKMLRSPMHWNLCLLQKVKNRTERTGSKVSWDELSKANCPISQLKNGLQCYSAYALRSVLHQQENSFLDVHLLDVHGCMLTRTLRLAMSQVCHVGEEGGHAGCWQGHQKTGQKHESCVSRQDCWDQFACVSVGDLWCMIVGESLRDVLAVGQAVFDVKSGWNRSSKLIGWKEILWNTAKIHLYYGGTEVTWTDQIRVGSIRK